MELKKLLEERAAVGNEMNQLTAQAIKDNGRSLNAEELERFDKMDADFKALTEKIETAKRLARAEEIAAPKENGKAVTSHRPAQITRQDQDLAFKAWALTAGGKGHLVTTRHTEAAHKVGMNLASDTHTVYLADRPNDLGEVQRNQSSGINSEGGYLQNDGVFQGLERNLKWFGGARQIARVIRTDTGEPISWAYSDDTGNVGGQLAQNTTLSNTSVVYSKKTLGEYTYVSSVYPVSVQLLQDARIDVSADVGEVLGIRLARALNPAYTSGLANAGPSGFLTDASSGATAAGATIAYTDLVKLQFSVDRAYRDDPSFCYTMSDSTLSALWQLEDVNGRPLFWNQMANIASDMPLTILGKRIVVNNDMPSVATGKKPICAIVGNKFIIRDVKEAQIVVLRERFMDQLAIGFMAYLRTDSKLLNANCAKYLVMP